MNFNVYEIIMRIVNVLKLITIGMLFLMITDYSYILFIPKDNNVRSPTQETRPITCPTLGRANNDETAQY